MYQFLPIDQIFDLIKMLNQHLDDLGVDLARLTAVLDVPD